MGIDMAVRPTHQTVAVLIGLAGAATSASWHSAWGAVSPMTESKARAIGVEAYLYLYPLVMMETARAQFTNVMMPDGIHAPPNTFTNLPPNLAWKAGDGVQPGLDTAYSVAWLDLAKGPVIVSIPDTNGRYYRFSMIDMWGNVFASPAWRKGESRGGNFALVPAGWTGTLPVDVTRIDAPTPDVAVFGLIRTTGPSDRDGVHAVQEGLKIIPLGRWGSERRVPVGTMDPAIDMKTMNGATVEAMTATTFFAAGTNGLKRQLSQPQDGRVIARMRQVGIEPGKGFDLDRADPAVRVGLQAAVKDALALMAARRSDLTRVMNVWSLGAETEKGHAGGYLKRAILSQISLTANLPEDATYAMNVASGTGGSLHGAHDYTVRFGKNRLPPAAAYWSITLYGADGSEVKPGPSGLTLSSRTSLAYNTDGSLDLYFRQVDPGVGKAANWLPTPSGSFGVLLKLYDPEGGALNGAWVPPFMTQDDHRAGIR